MVPNPANVALRYLPCPFRIAGIDGGLKFAMVFERFFRFTGQQDIRYGIERRVDAQRPVDRDQLGIA